MDATTIKENLVFGKAKLTRREDSRNKDCRDLKERDKLDSSKFPRWALNRFHFYRGDPLYPPRRGKI
ncbi:hypothetical protein V6Z12_D02G190200 [Gossypium hirsutum]